MQTPASEAVVTDVISSAKRIRDGQLTSITLVQACIDSIKSSTPTLNAFGDVYADHALNEARRLDAEAREGRFRGPLHGVPFGIKDLFHTAGLRTTRGSLTALDYVPTMDASIIQRLKAVGR